MAVPAAKRELELQLLDELMLIATTAPVPSEQVEFSNGQIEQLRNLATWSNQNKV